jgi:hypothetical protein
MRGNRKIVLKPVRGQNNIAAPSDKVTSYTVLTVTNSIAHSPGDELHPNIVKDLIDSGWEVTVR